MKPNSKHHTGGNARVPTHKTAPFVKLFDQLIEFHGSIEKACQACGLSSTMVYYRLIADGVLTVKSGKKILEAHKSIKTAKAL